MTLILHYVPESGEYEGGYEAVTMAGVPHGDFSIIGNDPDFSEGVLNNLFDGLGVFSFHGRVAVKDATDIDGMHRYEINLSR